MGSSSSSNYYSTLHRPHAHLFLAPSHHYLCQELPEAVKHRSPGHWANPVRPSQQLCLPELPAALEGALDQHFPTLQPHGEGELGSVSGAGVAWASTVCVWGRMKGGQTAFISGNPEGLSWHSSYSNLSP